MSWPIFLAGWAVCFVAGLAVSLLLWWATKSSFTCVGSCLVLLIGAVYGVASIARVLRASFDWHPAIILVASIVPGYLLGWLLMNLVGISITLVETAASKVIRLKPR